MSFGKQERQARWEKDQCSGLQRSQEPDPEIGCLAWTHCSNRDCHISKHLSLALKCSGLGLLLKKFSLNWILQLNVSFAHNLYEKGWKCHFHFCLTNFEGRLKARKCTSGFGRFLGAKKEWSIFRFWEKPKIFWQSVIPACSAITNNHSIQAKAELSIWAKLILLLSVSMFLKRLAWRGNFQWKCIENEANVIRALGDRQVFNYLFPCERVPQVLFRLPELTPNVRPEGTRAFLLISVQ